MSKREVVLRHRHKEGVQQGCLTRVPFNTISFFNLGEALNAIVKKDQPMGRLLGIKILKSMHHQLIA
jgi:hypothetical protein